MNIFKLVGSIFVDTEQANESIQKTDEKASNFAQNLGKGIQTVGKWGAAVVGGATAVVSGMIAVADKTAGTMDVVDKASQRMNISAESYQELAHAASLSGVEMTTLEKAAKKLEGTDLSLDDALDQIYAFGTAEERSAAAAELFGEVVAYQMSPMLNASAEGMAAMRQEANDLGLVFSQETVTAGAALNDAMSNVKDSFAALGTEIGTAIMPLVTEFAYKILEFMPTIREMVDRLAPLIVQLFDQLAPPLIQLVEALLPVILDTISALMPSITMIASSVLPIIVTLLQNLLPILTPILSLLTPILELANMILQPLLSLINVILPPLTSLINTFVSIVLERVKGQIETVKNVLTKFATVVKTTFQQIVSFVKTPVNTIIGVINGMIRGVVGGINGIINALNRLQISVPAWVTKLTGLTTFGFNLAPVYAPQIPLLAKGGEVEGTAIVGEAGPELLQTVGNRTRVTPLNENNNAFSDLSEKMDRIIELLQNGFGMSVNGRAMAAILAPDIDKELGALAAAGGRRI